MAWCLLNTLQLWFLQGPWWRLGGLLLLWWLLVLLLLLLHVACVRLPALVLGVLLLLELLLLHVLLSACVVGAATQAGKDRPPLGLLLAVGPLLLLLVVRPLLLLGCMAAPHAPATSKATTTTRLHPGLLLALAPPRPVRHGSPCTRRWGCAAALGPTRATTVWRVPALLLCQIIQAHVELLLNVTHGSGGQRRL
jgi:hypothetical protein